MLNLTSAQIAAAKAGDPVATESVLSELAPRIAYVARDAATVNGHLDSSLVDDYMQDASVAAWEALSKFEGSTVGQLSKYLDRYIGEAVADARRAEVTKGVNYDVSGFARHTYERALSKAGGDANMAEELAQSKEEFGSNALSAENARKAREANTRIEYLDAPAGEDGGTLMDNLVNTPAPSSMSEYATDRQRTHSVLEELRAKSPGYVSVMEHAAGLNGKRAFGMEHRRNGKGSRWVLRDAEGVAEELGCSVPSARNNWKRGITAFDKRWSELYGARSDSRERQPITEKGVALISAVKADDTHVFVKGHGRYVEFKHINENFNVVCTWTTRSRAVEVGLLDK